MTTQTLKDGKYTNPAYQVTLKTAMLDSSDANYLDIVGYLPETLSFNLTASWTSMLKDMLTGDIGEKIGGMKGAAVSMAQQFGRLTGMRTAFSQISSWPTWEGTEPLEFAIPFRFDAIRNTQADVVRPWITLQKLLCPVRDDAISMIFKAPGPQISLDESTKKLHFDEDRILSLKIGNFIYIKGVIVTAISNTLYSKFDKNGNPIQAQADVTLRTIFSPTTDDIENWFTCNENYYQTADVLNNLKEQLKKPGTFLSKVSGLDALGKLTGGKTQELINSGANWLDKGASWIADNAGSLGSNAANATNSGLSAVSDAASSLSDQISNVFKN